MSFSSLMSLFASLYCSMNPSTTSELSPLISTASLLSKPSGFCLCSTVIASLKRSAGDLRAFPVCGLAIGGFGLLLTCGLSFSSTSSSSSSDRPLLRPFLASLLSGGFAGFLSTALFYPLDFLRTRLAMDPGSDTATRLYPRGMRDVLSTTLKVDGVQGLYKGMSVSLFGVVLFRALHLGSYDFLKSELLPPVSPPAAGGGEGRGGARGGDIMSRVAIAQFVSVVAGTAVYPVDSVRRRLMMQAGKVDKLYATPMQCARVVLRTEGLRGFYKGIGPNVIRSVGGTIMLVSYDEFKALLNPKAPRLESYSV